MRIIKFVLFLELNPDNKDALKLKERMLVEKGS